MRGDTITRHTVDPVMVAAIEEARSGPACTRAELAGQYGVSVRTVNRWAKRGLLERTGHGRYRVPA